MLTACEKPMNELDVKNNSNPRMSYQILMTINDAPGPFENIEGRMHYRIENKSCIPEDPIAGVRQSANKLIKFPLKKIEDAVYSGEIQLDLLLGEDYFGLGTCHWKLSSISLSMEANKNVFLPGMTNEDIVKNKSKEVYFLKSEYSDKTYPGSSGGSILSKHIYENRKNFFSIMMEAKEIP